jgi:coenzyme PQQ precursor peptide PqqA
MLQLLASGTSRGSDETNVGGFVMSWNKPVVTEVCIGLEINDYFPAEI